MNKLLTALLISAGLWFLSAFTEGITTRNYPQNYFRSPVNTPIKLSGTFGELRSNHLHSGIDIKAHNGKTGQAILAVADGYVARIKVQSGGYGNVLYVNHPNGYTSVYAHLENFPKAIARYVAAEQKRKKTFEIELYPAAEKFNLKKGEKLGKMGLSGRSYGPHLHFEIRDTRTSKPINPLLFGLEAKDKLAPKLHELKIYTLNDKLETISTNTVKLKKGGKGYRIGGDTLLIGAWRIGVGLKAYDHMSLAPNWNGVYKMTMIKDDQPVYGFEMETFSFNESRYINAHLDYEEQVSNKAYINRFYELPGNRLSIYEGKKDKGIIQLEKNKATKIQIIASDVAGNDEVLEFWVKRTDVPEPPARSYNYLLPYDQANEIETEDFSLSMSNGTLYENLYFKYHSTTENSADVYSLIHHLHNYKTPVHKYFNISIRPVDLPTALREKAFIAYCQPDQKIITCGGKWNGDRLITKVRDLGDFSIMVDTEAPKIIPEKFSSNMVGYNRMTFKVTDNFASAPNVTQIDYDAYLDDNWILMEYDAKNDLLTHRFSKKLTKGTHRLRLVVRDDRKNEAVFEKTFVY